ncbi:MULTISPECIES: GlxA family transcriptional regulator [Mameliella]|nr:helix-turn-helix domain-containing protein [Mameliella sp. LZ-28]MCR9274643.1 helix-turn-helix domain-containing protein [Paracoccaceae bacterium]
MAETGAQPYGTRDMHVCLILFPGFPMLALSLVREVLRLANAQAEQRLFTLTVRTVNGAAVTDRDGTQVTGALPDWHGAQGFDLVLLCAGEAPLTALPMGLRAFLIRADAAGATLGGLDTGGTILARLGFLDGREAVLPDSAPAELPENVKRIALSRAPFALDRQRLTTAGGLAVADALTAWIARAQGPALAADTAEALAHGRMRDAGRCQRMAITADPLLERMQSIMAARIEAPIAVEKVATELGLSPKQLRLRCRKGLNRTPAQIYLDLRLARAEQLVSETTLPVSEIARAAGFASPSAFTRSYHARFGAPPRRPRHSGVARTESEQAATRH